MKQNDAIWWVYWIGSYGGPSHVRGATKAVFLLWGLRAAPWSIVWQGSYWQPEKKEREPPQSLHLIRTGLGREAVCMRLTQVQNLLVIKGWTCRLEILVKRRKEENNDTQHLAELGYFRENNRFLLIEIAKTSWVITMCQMLYQMLP